MLRGWCFRGFQGVARSFQVLENCATQKGQISEAWGAPGRRAESSPHLQSQSFQAERRGLAGEEGRLTYGAEPDPDSGEGSSDKDRVVHRTRAPPHRPALRCICTGCRLSHRSGFIWRSTRATDSIVRFTSASFVRQLTTLIRIARRPRHVVPLKNAAPSALIA